MLWHIARFEIRYWLRSWMPWIFMLIIGSMIFLAVSTESGPFGLFNIHANSPYLIQNFYAAAGFFTLMMVMAFMNSAATRDFSHNMYEIIFTTRLKRHGFLLGRFLGATAVALMPILGGSIAILLAKYMPWVDPDRWGPISWGAHIKGILIFAVPNTFFMAAILFTIAVLARSDIVSFVGTLGVLTGYIVSRILMEDMERESLAALLDPFALRTFFIITKYWTVAEKNTGSVGLTGLLLWNRLIWTGVGTAFLTFAYYRFSFAERRTKARRVPRDETSARTADHALPSVSTNTNDGNWAKFLACVKIHLFGIVKSPVFIVIIVAALMIIVPSLTLGARQGYGNSTLPVTYWILEIIDGNTDLLVLILTTYFAGVLVWKDRDRRCDEINDALPMPEWMSYLSRFTALAGMVMTVQLVGLLSGIVTQACYGYYRFQIGLYLNQLLVRDGSSFIFFAVLAFFIHVLSPNKYLGYFIYIVFLIANSYIWSPLNVATYLVQFSKTPSVTYSDFYGDAPYIAAWRWFTLYWAFFSGLLAVVAIMFWPRGRDSSWIARWHCARLRFQGAWRPMTFTCLLVFAATGCWIYYNTKIVNHLSGPKDMTPLQVDYEKSYKELEGRMMPRIRSFKYNIDVFPETRNMVMRGEEVIDNPYSQPLNEVHFSLSHFYDTSLDIPGTKLAKDDTRLSYRIYRFTPPLQPGESRTMTFIVKSRNRGFENSVSNPTVMQNGTFFNNMVGPVIGYEFRREVTDPNDRRKYGLGELTLMRPLERDCTDNCQDNYIARHSDWVDMHTVISRSPDQIAIAPGTLVREWQEKGRRYFEYQIDHPSIAFFSFLSGRYEVSREDWNGIKLEVYYNHDHPWNLPRMMNSLRKSLDYFTRSFGPYYQKEARIIEFPRVADFAQSFAGTMPFSESIGFIANLNHTDDIDMVFYTVAHEMAHQWWGHQVGAANMQGATFLCESLAEYSALMVMEKEYGRDMMRKCLWYEMNSYLRSRGTERLKERPLLTVEHNQDYIHYYKGGVAMYYLKEMIGENAVNAALRRLIQQYAYNSPPYPTSWALVDALSAVTPPQYQYLIKDLFEDITLFSNRALEATARKRADGRYDVTVNIETRKFKADAKGNETEVPVDDWIEIGAFAKPERGHRYGRTLYRQRAHMRQPPGTYTFTVSDLPEKAGVDPFMLLVDRIPDDNVRNVTVLGDRAAK